MALSRSEKELTVGNSYGASSKHNVTSSLPSWDSFCFTVRKENMPVMSMRMNNQILRGEQIIPYFEEFTVSTTWKFKLASFNIYSKSLQQQTPECGALGDIYPWDPNNWTSDKFSQIDQMLDAEICKNTILFKYPAKKMLSEAIKDCKRLGGKMPLFEELNQDIFSFYNITNARGNELFLPLTLENGKYRNLFDQEIVDFNRTFWKMGQPNGGTEDTGIACNALGCDDTKESYERYFLCKLENPMKLKVRGLCPDSKIDNIYIPLSKPTGSSEITMVGKNSHIKYSAGNWKLFIHNSRTTAESKASKDSMLLGTHPWKINNDPICTGGNENNLDLSFNTCKEDAYNCENGDCIDIHKLCDGKYDCPDNSDEHSCEKVYITGNYNKNFGEIGLDNMTKVDITTEIVSLLAIDDKEGTIRAQLKIQLNWKDSRLGYMNLKDSSLENTLGTKEANGIWRPRLQLFDTNIYQREQHKNETVTVMKNKNDTPTFAPNFLVYNGLFYINNPNTLQLKTWLRLIFI